MFSTVFRPYPNLRTICLGIVTHHGASHDTLAGSTQVLLQTMARGTKQHNENEIARMIDGTGGTLFSATEKDFSIIGAQIQPKFAVRTLDLLCEMISLPTLDENHILIEKQNLIQIFHQVQSNPVRRMLLFDADKAAFGETHPLGRPQIGTPDSLNQLTKDDLQKTHQELLVQPWGFTVGAISDSLQKKINQKFSEFSNTLETKVQKSQSFPQRVTPPNHLISRPMKEDGSVYLCINITIELQPSLIGLARFSSALLGESFGSRMFAILRDQKAFGYIAGATLKLFDNMLIQRYFMETSPKRTEEAIDSLVEILTDMGKEEISLEEYDTTRDFMLGQLDLAFDDSRQTASKIINRKVHGLSPQIESGYEEIQGVTRKELHSWWKTTLLRPENFSLAISGNIDSSKIEENWTSKTYNVS
ncbi:MAG: insulinase family protein [Candidatus Heimdallarchaeota archaeon]|nr:MAG: insulinase family protein [Candidatus Heimdallarchaeota archaeon]